MKPKQILSVVLGSTLAIMAIAADPQTPPKKDDADDVKATVIGPTNLVGTIRSIDFDAPEGLGLEQLLGGGTGTKIKITQYNLEMREADKKTNSFVSLSTGKSEINQQFRKLTDKQVTVGGVLSYYKKGAQFSLVVSSLKEKQKD